MTNETLTEQLKKLLSKVNSIQGQQLTFAQRLKALEEKEPSEAPDNELLIKVATYLGFIPKPEEVVEDEIKEIIEEVAEVVEETEEIEAEVLEELEEIIERD